MAVPNSGFCIRVVRDRVESSGNGPGKRIRTVGSYRCYGDGKEIDDDMLRGATVEPKGPGDTKASGTANARRIQAGTYAIGTHAGLKYRSSGYEPDKPPRPGLWVFDTGYRDAILIHRGIGFAASIGCINITGSITGPSDLISAATSYGRVDYLIRYLKDKFATWPSSAPRRLGAAVVLIEGEPT